MWRDTGRREGGRGEVTPGAHVEKREGNRSQEGSFKRSPQDLWAWTEMGHEESSRALEVCGWQRPDGQDQEWALGRGDMSGLLRINSWKSRAGHSALETGAA